MLFAIEDVATGGGIVGGALSLAGGIYLLWERLSKRRTEARRERLRDRATKIKLDKMARESLSEAHAEEIAARKAAHDADIRAIRREIEESHREIAENKRRIAELETEGRACHEKTGRLQSQNDEQAKEIKERTADITDLRAHIATLEQRLKAAGSLPPGSGPHDALTR